MAISVREGAISSSTLLKRLRSGSRKNATYTAFREVGRVIRTVQLLRYLSDTPLRRRVTAATNKVEAFNGFSQWLGFGNRGVIADNDPVEQEKAMKFNALLTNAVVFHNALDIAEIVRQLLEEGWEIDPEELARISPYLTEHINRFGEYSTHELGIQPEAYDPKLDSRLHPATRAGSDRGWLWSGCLKRPGRTSRREGSPPASAGTTSVLPGAGSPHPAPSWTSTPASVARTSAPDR
ncbi:Tn3 family transposase [Streptomyces sp. DSM 41013]